jgi:hypothetical protein
MTYDRWKTRSPDDDVYSAEEPALEQQREDYEDEMQQNDFSKPETKALFEAEVRKRMEEPFFMTRAQSEMLVAALLSGPVPPADKT